MKLVGILVFLTLLPIASAVPADFYVTEVSPQILEPGETETLDITLKNLAPNYALYFTSSLDPDDTSPIDVVGIQKKYVDVIEGATESNLYFGQISQSEEVSVSTTVKVKDSATEGVHQVPLILEWKDELLNDVTQTLYVGIRIKGNALMKVAKVATSPVELRSDSDKNKVTITVENAGKTTAKSVGVDVKLTEPFTEAYSGSSSDFTAEISPDDSKDFEVAFDIADNAQADEYTLPLKLTYRTTDSSFEVDDVINIKISSRADFDVGTVTTNPDLINPGTDFIINLPVKNVGQERAESVKAVIKTKSYFVGVKTDYLGDIKPGESKIATFDLNADRDTILDNYETDITFIWSEGDERLEETTSFGITVASVVEEGGPSTGIAVGFLVIIGITGILLWRKLR